MRVFIAGAAGALGRQLVPLARAAGHDVVGTTRYPSRQLLLQRLGAHPVVVDALDETALKQVVAAAEPDVIVHQLTAIPQAVNMRRFDREFAATNRLRTQGTDNLLAAAQAAGVTRFVAQSNGAVPYVRSGSAVKSEDDPFDVRYPKQMRKAMAAIRYLENAIQSADWVDGIVLRPILTGPSAATVDPAAYAEMSDTLSMAFLVLLERLTPEQRAVFLLREVFDYEYAEIARIINRSETACRQLASRARREVAGERRRFEAAGPAQAELTNRFLEAARAGDMAGLEALLAHDAALHADGGGQVQAIVRPIFGRTRVARAVLRYFDVAGVFEKFAVQIVEVNGFPGAIGLSADGRVLAAMELDILDGQIQAIRSVANPDKLAHLGSST